MNPAWRIGTGRLVLTPVNWGDMAELQALKGDPQVYAQMLGGVRGPMQVVNELADDVAFWAARGVGMWMVRSMIGGAAVGVVGLHERPDGRGIALRFAFTPASRGHGYAREAGAAALRFAHERAHLIRVIAVSRESNIGSRTVLGAIGMRECETFVRGSEAMMVFESVASN